MTGLLRIPVAFVWTACRSISPGGIVPDGDSTSNALPFSKIIKSVDVIGTLWVPDDATVDTGSWTPGGHHTTNWLFDGMLAPGWGIT
jgi:hypothetical protein